MPPISTVKRTMNLADLRPTIFKKKIMTKYSRRSVKYVTLTSNSIFLLITSLRINHRSDLHDELTITKKRSEIIESSQRI